MTALTQSISGCYLEDNGIDSMTQNETQSYISGDTATGVLNFVEGFLVRNFLLSMTMVPIYVYLLPNLYGYFMAAVH